MMRWRERGNNCRYQQSPSSSASLSPLPANAASRITSPAIPTYAQGHKLAINLLNSKDVDEVFRAHININALRFGMLGSTLGSVMGCLFLMLSRVNVIEIRMEMLSCGSRSVDLR